MTNYYDNWDHLADDLVEVDIVKTPHIPNTGKINKIMQYIQANNKSNDVRRIVDRFNLDWTLEHDCGNGIGRIAFWSNESQRDLVMEMHLPINEWFRN